MNSDPEGPPRPASHRWTIGIFGFVSFGFTLILINAYTGRSAGSLWDMPVASAILWVTFIAFLAMLVGRRRTWAYYTVSACHAAWCIRGLQSFFFFLPAITSPFTWPYPFSILVIIPLLIFLSYRFVFGTASRSYYGLRPIFKRAK